MSFARRFTKAVGFAVLVGGGCTRDDSSAVRGRGLVASRLPPAEQARVYEAAARAAYDASDPSLSLLVDPRQLPRGVGLAPEGRLSDTVLSELKGGELIKGTCEPPLTGARGAPRCKAALPGYVLRFSPIFTIRGDSTQVYVYSQQYDNAESGRSQPRRFERAYQVVRHGNAWRAVREGSVPKAVRGESK
jgi:hypothetical protein